MPSSCLTSDGVSLVSSKHASANAGASSFIHSDSVRRLALLIGRGVGLMTGIMSMEIISALELWEGTDHMGSFVVALLQDHTDSHDRHQFSRDHHGGADRVTSFEP